MSSSNLAGRMGATNDAYVFCLTAGAGAAWGCTDPASLNKWVKVAPHDGTPVADDAVRMVYDTANHRVLTYGGTATGGGTLHIVQQYDPATGDWCVSDTSQGGSNAASCTLPAVSGPTPPGMRFAPWTFDNKRGKAALYAGPGALYTYDRRPESMESEQRPRRSLSAQRFHERYQLGLR